MHGMYGKAPLNNSTKRGAWWGRLVLQMGSQSANHRPPPCSASALPSPMVIRPWVPEVSCPFKRRTSFQIFQLNGFWKQRPFFFILYQTWAFTQVTDDISQTASNEVKPTRAPHIVSFQMKTQTLSIVPDVPFHRRMLITVQFSSSSYAASCFLWTPRETGLKLVVLQKNIYIQDKYRGKQSILSVMSVVWCYRIFWMKWRGPSEQAARILSRKHQLQFIKTIQVMFKLHCKADYKICSLPLFLNAYTERRQSAAVIRILHITEEAHGLQTVQTSRFCVSRKTKKQNQTTLHVFACVAFQRPCPVKVSSVVKLQAASVTINVSLISQLSVKDIFKWSRFLQAFI